MLRVHSIPFGAHVRSDGVQFRFWAQDHQVVLLELSGLDRWVPMEALGTGWHQLTTDLAAAGTRYRYVLPDGSRVPDPASRFQPEDVHGPSEVVDPCSYEWRDDRFAVMKTGETVEIAAIGREGAIGTKVGFYPQLAFAKAVVQLPGVASASASKNSKRPPGTTAPLPIWRPAPRTS